MIAFGVGHGEIELTIAVEIPHRHPPGVQSYPISHRFRKGTIAPAQHYLDRIQFPSA